MRHNRCVPLQSQPVDPRDQQSEVRPSGYRVTFWRSSGTGWTSREYQVSDGDVADAIQWANENAAADETFVLSALIDGSVGRGVVHLVGVDPTAQSEGSPI